jgi:hypothetical protein
VKETGKLRGKGETKGLRDGGREGGGREGGRKGGYLLQRHVSKTLDLRVFFLEALNCRLALCNTVGVLAPAEVVLDLRGREGEREKGKEGERRGEI